MPRIHAILSNSLLEYRQQATGEIRITSSLRMTTQYDSQKIPPMHHCDVHYDKET